jgi:iron complex transport system substrate-binding protein
MNHRMTLRIFSAALAMMLLLLGCSAALAEETEYPLTLQVYDADGNQVEVTYDHAPEKVLSTQLSMTELLINLGLKDKIVAVFDNDNALTGDLAEEVASLTSLGDKKSVSKEAILAVEPDLILGKGPLMFTESSIGTVQYYQELGIPVYTELASASVDQSLSNIVEDVRNIGKIFNVQDTANAYADELQGRIDALLEKVSGQSGETKKVLFMAGYSDGTFVAFNSKMSSCMLNALHAENVLDKGGNGLTLENLVAMNPDVIVYIHADRFASTDEGAVEALTSNEVVQDVTAIAGGKVIEMAYDDMMDYGARIIDAAETLYDFMYAE